MCKCNLHHKRETGNQVSEYKNKPRRPTTNSPGAWKHCQEHVHSELTTADITWTQKNQQDFRTPRTMTAETAAGDRLDNVSGLKTVSQDSPERQRRREDRTKKQNLSPERGGVGWR